VIHVVVGQHNAATSQPVSIYLFVLAPQAKQAHLLANPAGPVDGRQVPVCLNDV
jgi:hypothetical protein